MLKLITEAAATILGFTGCADESQESQASSVKENSSNQTESGEAQKSDALDTFIRQPVAFPRRGNKEM